MNTAFDITPVSVLPSGIDELRREAKAEGFNFLDRLIDDWCSGSNRFAQPGEVLLAGFRANELIAIGGFNRDPYTDDADVGRLRHIYVHGSSRRLGVGSALVRALLHHSDGIFRMARLKTETKETEEFYVRLGFHAVQDSSATHVRFNSCKPAASI